ncbi:hypothetical protein BJV78DRAFT_1121288 [Lactifluus subvellereus]|nr:hypothetical protein BJV78DRAFT_1121288 [Lactifluus subvellereus]
MASTSTATRSPPPTTNNLDAAQRARIMRSSRKLGAVLGTTPFLLESCGGTVSVSATLHPASKKRHDTRTPTRPSHVKRHHRKYSVLEGISSDSFETSSLVSFSHAAASSEESLLHAFNSSTEELPAAKSRSHQRAGDTPPHPLVLRLNTMPLSPSDSRAQPVPLSPLSPNADIPPWTPATPVEPSRAEIRRRKMARVVRTLGENVPPELLHEARSISRSRSTTTITRSRPRSSSLGEGPQWQRLLELPAPVFSSSTRAPKDQQWVGAWNRKNIAQVQRELRTLRH